MPACRRRKFLLTGVLLLGGLAMGVQGQDANPRPLVGAIRWDAWTGGHVTQQVERTLTPAKYQHRLPWFAEVRGDGDVRIDGGRQEVMDREIEFAADAGLDYWAFLLYAEASSMSVALTQYLKSPERERISFCLILHSSFSVSPEQWPVERDRAVALLNEPGYQRVMGGRPLVYAFGMEHGAGFPKERFAEFLAAARDTGLDPYCVYMGWNPVHYFRTASSLGFEAVSHYACGSADDTFARLCKRAETSYWEKAAAAQVPYVPLVTTGWDKRPRQDNPVSWEKGHSYHQQTVFPSMARPEEIAEHLDRALAFVRAHSDICPAKTVIVYAWNEYDEGGWLAPTWTPEGQADNARLTAVRQVLLP